MPQGGGPEAAYNSNMRMKTHPVATILTSAYLSAMLTSSLAPIRNNTIFAAAVDPMAAQKAFQGAVSGLDAAGWAAAVQAPTVAVPAPAAVPAPSAAPSDPAMTEELMARLVKFTLTGTKPTKFSGGLAQLLGINDGTADLQILRATEQLPDSKFSIMVPTMAGSKDIILSAHYADHNEFYLTDKSTGLRAAMIQDKQGNRLITNEQAAERYQALLKFFAKVAQGLPPTGAAVAGNS